MELYINDTLVDLDKSVPFPLTYNISDIREVNTRKGNTSKTITLPGTQVNNRLMSSVFLLSTTDKQTGGSPLVVSFDTSIKATARYYEKGVLQFEGACQLMECIKKSEVWTFQIVLFSETIDFIGELKNYKIAELGWSEYNHTLTYANQQASWTGTIQKNGGNYSNISGTQWLGEGYYYGLIDYGYDRQAADAFAVEDIPPQIFLKSIIDKMFERIDVSYSSTFFGSQLFKKCLLAYEGGVLPIIDAALAAQQSLETDQLNDPTSGKLIDTNIITVESTGNDTFTGALWGDFLMWYLSDSATDVDPSSQIQNHLPLQVIAQYEGNNVLNYAGDHDVNWNINITSGSGSAVHNYKIETYGEVYLNNSMVQEKLLWVQDVVGSSTLTNSFTATFDVDFNLALEVSDEVEFRIKTKVVVAQVVDTSATAIDIDFDVTATNCELDLTYQAQGIQAGGTINIMQFLPKMDCATFFKGVIDMFNLYVKPSTTVERTLIIEPLNTFYNGSSRANDWTQLVDYSKDFKVTPTVNLATKDYTFEFMHDVDYWNERYFGDVSEQYGAKTISSGSQYTVGETVTKLPFANKLIGQIPDTDLIMPRNFTVKTSEDGSSEVTPKKGKSFVVQIKNGVVGTMQTADWWHVDELDVAHAETQYPYVGHLDDIDSPGFDLMFNLPSYVFYDIPTGINYTTNNLYIYHEKFIKEILDKNGKMLTAYIHLNASDINTLDFADLVNIDGVVYRLQKVENYDSRNDSSTKCEFIRLIEAESIQTYDYGELFELEEDPYAPPSTLGKRIVADGNPRVTEDGLEERFVE